MGDRTPRAADADPGAAQVPPDHLGVPGLATPDPPSAPAPCRPQDLGAFELTQRDGAARLGRLHTRHGLLTTPALLPVVNPNLRTIAPRRMWDTFGVRGLITNSYVIWKHDHLRSTALMEGVHALLDFPGVVMTDSGTFQAYVYGDVEVEVEEIVAFQRAMGVDIATMLDVFGKPDEPLEVLEAAVATTAARGPASLAAAKALAFQRFGPEESSLRWEVEADDWRTAGFAMPGHEGGMSMTGEWPSVLLNGPVQGGPHPGLRRRSGEAMGALGFDVHPVGGIVPLMEQQRYRELAAIVLAAKAGLPAGRPVHLFGCGHPQLFPLAVALGADLLDSAAYALFARDGRLLSAEGTLRLSELEHWPQSSPAVWGRTPAEVRALGKHDRTRLLAEHNLWVTMGEIERCRQAVHEGRIWELVEQRSRAHPALREAYAWLAGHGDAPATMQLHVAGTGDGIDEAEALRREGRAELVTSSTPVRDGGLLWNGRDTLDRPYVAHARRLLHGRWRAWPEADGEVVILTGVQPPYRRHLAMQVRGLAATRPGAHLLLHTPLGLLPWTLEDLDPWSHIQAPDRAWSELPMPDVLEPQLAMLGLDGREVHIVHAEEVDALAVLGGGGSTADEGALQAAQDRLDRLMVRDKVALFCGVDPAATWPRLADAALVRNREGRVKNVLDRDGIHLCSPRLMDGGLSLTAHGARWLDGLRAAATEAHPGLARVAVTEDAVPFVSDGRSVFCGFTGAVDAHLVPGLPCVVTGPDGGLLAHGTARHTARELATFRKGVAVKVREAVPNLTESSD